MYLPEKLFLIFQLSFPQRRSDISSVNFGWLASASGTRNNIIFIRSNEYSLKIEIKMREITSRNNKIEAGKFV